MYLGLFVQHLRGLQLPENHLIVLHCMAQVWRV